MLSEGYDPFSIESSSRQLEEETRAREKQKEQLEGDIKWLMGSPRGRRIIWWLISAAGVYRSTFDINDPDPSKMSFREGYRNFGLMLLNVLTAYCPELYHAMLKENNNASRIRS